MKASNLQCGNSKEADSSTEWWHPLVPATSLHSKCPARSLPGCLDTTHHSLSKNRISRSLPLAGGSPCRRPGSADLRVKGMELKMPRTSCQAASPRAQRVQGCRKQTGFR